MNPRIDKESDGILEVLLAEPIQEASLRLLKTHVEGNKMAKVYKDHEWGEYRVKHYTDGKHHEKADHHTDDEEDAHSTAKYYLSNSGNVKAPKDKTKAESIIIKRPRLPLR